MSFVTNVFMRFVKNFTKLARTLLLKIKNLFDVENLKGETRAGMRMASEVQNCLKTYYFVLL